LVVAGFAMQTWFDGQVADDREAPQKFVVTAHDGVPIVGVPPAVQLGFDEAER